VKITPAIINDDASCHGRLSGGDGFTVPRARELAAGSPKAARPEASGSNFLPISARQSGRRRRDYRLAVGTGTAGHRHQSFEDLVRIQHLVEHRPREPFVCQAFSSWRLSRGLSGRPRLPVLRQVTLDARPGLHVAACAKANWPRRSLKWPRVRSSGRQKPSGRLTTAHTAVPPSSAFGEPSRNTRISRLNPHMMDAILLGGVTSERPRPWWGAKGLGLPHSPAEPFRLAFTHGRSTIRQP
jgi:hypothetical protein